jgi:hypothetical protein
LAASSCVAVARVEAAEPSASGQAADEEMPVSKAPEPTREEPLTRPPPEEIEAPAPVRHTAIYWLFGANTPVGVTGFEGVHRFTHSFELAAGFGQGMAAASAQPNGRFGHALQWAIMPRVRLGDDRDVLTLGAGLSGGEYTNQGLCFGCDDGESMNATYPTYYTLWANLEIGGEFWTRGGFAFRCYLGVARGVMVESHPADASPDLPLPYFGFGLGYAF